MYSATFSHLNIPMLVKVFKFGYSKSQKVFRSYQYFEKLCVMVSNRFLILNISFLTKCLKRNLIDLKSINVILYVKRPTVVMSYLSPKIKCTFQFYKNEKFKEGMKL